MCRKDSTYEARLGPEASGLVALTATEGVVASELAREMRLPVELLLRELETETDKEGERQMDRGRERERRKEKEG